MSRRKSVIKRYLWKRAIRKWSKLIRKHRECLEIIEGLQECCMNGNLRLGSRKISLKMLELQMIIWRPLDDKLRNCKLSRIKLKMKAENEKRH